MKPLLVTPAPHMKSKDTNARVMLDVLIALLPATVAALFFFGFNAVIIILTGLISAWIFELIALKLKKAPVTRADLRSASITGLLLALIIAPSVPWWMVVVGTFIAIFIAKHAFGGLGHNIFNPALIGRAFMVASWPILMTAWLKPFDAIATATPLATVNPAPATYLQLFLGNVGGSMGETSALALLIGAAYLFYRQAIEWRLPFAYLGTVVVISLIFRVDPVFQLLSGGLMIGAFFMATDPVTTPVTKPGRLIFGIGCGIITMVLRMGAGYPEGVCYSILLMNATTPLLDRYARGRIFGYK
ncbi:MAG: RnfABCDGE type electron transport complex subunit D [Candidatus Margulisbacteria bacterium]|nr:RnfABCDGE type electron transport complex subunit D [Candidatus Margulisiibacteriota bacterium]MBU1022396.1 RnfABCDGE type electron transport complex subunit D [Candidatus Margulisiibacteriota bacterium]MBU1729052.1 RnfABCDGE type electron transport complex subunit D [Candidatus Margulisiibacteriota bacterium]MBU1954527.1 RnfABCDGE type electron transport complex subunit D [Candidatus Margulisiibacteriota bacterium]